jgi:hypothetical protein
MPGEILRIQNFEVFDQVLAKVEKRRRMDPAAVHDEAVPGFLSGVAQRLGAWRGREERRFEVPLTSEKARAVSRLERAHHGEQELMHIVAKQGVEAAAPTQAVLPKHMEYGGIERDDAIEQASRPIWDWNRTFAEILLDVFTQGAFSDSNDSPTEGFAWSVEDQHGNTVQKDTIAESEDEVPDVVAHSGQSATWPLRDGTLTGTGHDHVDTSVSAPWDASAGQTARDHITEHPGNGSVRAIAGSNIAADVQDTAKTERGAIESRVQFIEEAPDDDAGPFADVEAVARIESVNYFHSPEIPDDMAVYYAGNAAPLYASVGAVGANGEELANGGWTENLEETTGGELKGRKFGFRQFLNAGVHDPTAMFIQAF